MTLLGVGAMNSPRYRPAGLCLACEGRHVMFDGGGSTVPPVPVDAWLVTDGHSELSSSIRRAGARLGLEPRVATFETNGLRVSPMGVEHTSHPTCGYLIEDRDGMRRAAWAPEFWVLPAWVAGVELLFADAAGWRSPIRFRNRVGGHASVVDTAARARALGVRRLVFAHIGRPSIRAIDRGDRPPFGEWGTEGSTYRL
jgi:hypothetical protein